jgi:hypothetical protein
MEVDEAAPPPQLKDLDTLTGVRAFFQGSLTSADLANVVGYPVAGSNSVATVETVRAALNPPVTAANGLCTGHVLALQYLLLRPTSPGQPGGGILVASAVSNTVSTFGTLLIDIDRTLEHADGGSLRLGKLANRLCHTAAAQPWKRTTDKGFKSKFGLDRNAAVPWVVPTAQRARGGHGVAAAASSHHDAHGSAAAAAPGGVEGLQASPVPTHNLRKRKPSPLSNTEETRGPGGAGVPGQVVEQTGSSGMDVLLAVARSFN